MDELKFDKNRYRVKNCPCGKSNRDGKFAPFKGFENKGYCHSCGDTFLPDLQPLENKPYYQRSFQPVARTRPREKPDSFIPFDKVERSMQSGLALEQIASKNHFIRYLISLFGQDITDQVRKRYFIGTSDHWEGATTFWQVDIHERARTGKIFVYSPITGKRVKEPKELFYWEHKALNQPEFNLRQCFFGEQLLKGNNLPVAIVESEKSAIIGSIYFPEYIWLATGGKNGLTAEKCEVLKGRTVILFPDLSKPDDKDNVFDLWSRKAKEYSCITSFAVSDLLEVKANELQRKEGLDFADYLLTQKIKEFRAKGNQDSFMKNLHETPDDLPDSILKNGGKTAQNRAKTSTNPPGEDTPVKRRETTEKRSENQFNERQQPIQKVLESESFHWGNEISELESFFTGIELPTQPIKLNQSSTITNITLFIESHIATIKANGDNRYFLPYIDRLKQLKEVL